MFEHKFEHRHEKLLPRRQFVKRLLKFALISIILVIVSLVVGMIGYHFTAGLSWVDSFLNASMILAGMGQVDTLHSDTAKIFAGFYALYSGLAVIVAIAIFAAPLFHRFLHHFHLEGEKASSSD